MPTPPLPLTTPMTLRTFGGSFADPALDDALRQFERQENIDLEILADEVERNFPDGAGFAHAGIVPQNIKVPRLGLTNIVGVGQIEAFDADLVAEAQRRDLFAQRSDLRRDLDGRDDIVAVARHADRSALAEAASGAGDEDGLAHI